MDIAICKEVIISTIARRGTGKDIHSPIRVITQVLEKDGTLIAENDPSPETFVAFDLINFARWCNEQGLTEETINPKAVYKWLDSISTKELKSH